MKENPKDPFHAVCYINDKICGKGNGNSKKAAKNTAGLRKLKHFYMIWHILTNLIYFLAEAALCVLIPDFKGQASDTKKNNDEMYSVSLKIFFVAIEKYP